MTLVLPEGFGTLHFRMELPDVDHLTSFQMDFFQSPAPETQAELRSTVADVNSLWLDDIWINAIGDWIWKGIHGEFHTTDDTLLVAEVNDTENAPNAGAPLPPNVSELVRKVTGLAGRRNRGRMYIGPAFLAEGSVTAAGTFDPTNENLAWGQFYDSLVTLRDIWHPVVLHSDPAFAPTEVLVFDVQGKVATQRRRLR